MPNTTRLRTALFATICVFFALSIILTVVHPTKPAHALPHGISSPVVGLEMALNPRQVWDVLGDPQSVEGQSSRAAFLLGTRLDFLYIAVYSLAYILLTLLMVSRQGAARSWIYATLVAVGITALADVMENLAIFSLLDTGSESLVDLHIDQLIVFTRIKWLFLGISGLPAVVLLRRESRRGPSFLLTVAFAFGALSIVKQYAAELMTLFLAFFWAFLFVKLLPLKNRWWN